MTYTGTNHFRTIRTAVAYYKTQGENSEAVYQKIKEQAIIIGRIPQNWKGRFDDEGRFIREE